MYTRPGSYGSVCKPPTAVKTIPYSLHPDPMAYIALALSDDAFRRSGYAIEQTPMLTYVRTGFDGHPVPQRKALSRAVQQSSRGEECQTSTRDQGEQPDGRVHRRTRCRKRQQVADAPRFNGSVLPAYVERLRHGSPAELYGPSRLLMRYSGGLLYIPKDL
jgi:hypothetical protein